MCGIAAIVARSGQIVPASLPGLFSRELAHRGPDAEGLATFDRAGATCAPERAELALIHRRLSIIDLDPRSNQPMTSADGRYVLVFNGEIYNYLELRAELLQAGHRFHTQSDSEVLLAAYAAWGEDALTRFTGMFAFVILDRGKRELFMARDPFGIKPLLWTAGDHHFAIASEIPPLLDVPGVSRRIDHQRVCLFLAAGQSDEGERTMFADVHSLPAGSFARLSLDAPAKPSPVRYWTPTIAPRERSKQTVASELRDALLESVQLHLRSDVPTGIALSGGIDSTAVLACARRIGGPSLDIRTFSFAAAGSDVDETRYVELAAREFGAESHIVRIAPDEIVRDIDKLVAVQGEPFGSLSIYAQNRVMRLARENGIKVILEGQGADELFGGYRPYLARRLSQLLGTFQLAKAARFVQAMWRLPDANTALVAQALEPAIPLQWRALMRHLAGKPLLPAWVNTDWFVSRGEFSAPHSLKPKANFLHEALSQSLTTTVLPALLRYGDRNSMAHSIESRVPFLTTKLAELAYSLPAEELVDGAATSKAALRRALRGLAPDEILDRRDKIGFATPDRLWAQALKPWFETTLNSDTAKALPWLDSAAARRALSNRIANDHPFGFDLYRTVAVVRWIEKFNAVA